MRILYLGLFLFIVIMIGGCTNDDFKLSNQNAVQVGLYSRSTAIENDTTLSGIYIYGVDEAEEEKVLAPYENAKVKNLFLPLNFQGETTEGSTRFKIVQERTVGDGKKTSIDEITFYHRKELVFISGETGMFYNMVIDDIQYTNNLIDTVRLEYEHVKYNENKENVKIYIEP